MLVKWQRFMGCRQTSVFIENLLSESGISKHKGKKKKKQEKVKCVIPIIRRWKSLPNFVLLGTLWEQLKKGTGNDDDVYTLKTDFVNIKMYLKAN